MDELEIYRRRAAVRQRALKRLGVPNIQCICGETDPVCFEVEHIDRRANSDIVWGMCKNCHARKSARELALNPPVGMHPGNRFEREGHALLGEAEYLYFIVERKRTQAEIMFKLAGRGIVIDD
jgi:hypothetical protein